MTHDKAADDTNPHEGRLAGIDYGTVRVGIAISDPGQTIASPFENYTRRSEELDSQFFRELVTEESICLLYTSPSPRDATLSRMPSSA